ncbi:helix-turn-helix transcriptional regulator [Streptomyces varsoviensis]|uniref:helix-turn-helix domain-containing protein n=1 Tax=Streptomyces varsoviensis TaxID=67373 RepID=UPI0033C8FABC
MAHFRVRAGAGLRRLRNRAGLSGDQAAAILDAGRARIGNIEAGRIDVSRNRLYKLLPEYGRPPGPLFDGLMEMAQELGKGGGTRPAMSWRRPGPISPSWSRGPGFFVARIKAGAFRGGGAG